MVESVILVNTMDVPALQERSSQFKKDHRKAPPKPTETEDSLVLRAPKLEDAPHIWNLVDACKPLDLNSRYAYALLCHHFAETCVVAEWDSRLVGFLSAYRPPTTKDVIFVWQVAVHSDARGQGLGGRLLDELVRRPACEGVSYLETTVTPTNSPSLALFRSFAEKLDAHIGKAGLFPNTVFGETDHEEEVLYRIGPFDRIKLAI